MVTGERIADWLSKLVRIPSVNPVQTGPRAGTPGEAAIAAAVEAWFRELGAETFRETVLPGRPNVYGVWPGHTDRWVALDVHVDTVGVEQMTGDPFDGRIDGGRVYGRGAVDTKASLAVALALMEAARDRELRPAPGLVIAATVDEEVGALGAPVFAEWIRRRDFPVRQIAVAEPTRCGPVVAHRGAVRLEVRVKGTPAHSSQPHLGKNAITAACRVALALDEEHQRLQALPRRTLLDPAVLTVTLMRGGTGPNVVPDVCSLLLDRRLVAGESPEAVAASLSELVRRASPLPCEIELLKQFPAFSQSADSDWVRQLREWSGRSPEAAPYGTNAWAYGDLDADCVVIGPGSIDQAHGAVEWVEVSELEKMAGIYASWWELSAA